MINLVENSFLMYKNHIMQVTHRDVEHSLKMNHTQEFVIYFKKN